MSKLKNAAAWLGLVADDRYDDYDEDDRDRGREHGRDRDTRDRDGRDRGSARGRRDDHDHRDADYDDEYTEDVELTEDVADEDSAEIHHLESRRGSRAPELARGGRATIRESDADDEEPSVADLSRISTVSPRTYNEARTIGEQFREGVPVIMNLGEMDDADAKRLVDFAAGLIFGLHGRIERVTNKVFLLSPKNVTVTAEDKQRIAGGFYNQS